jgi:MFS family permease
VSAGNVLAMPPLCTELAPALLRNSRFAPYNALNYYVASVAMFITGRFLASLAGYVGLPGRVVLAISAFGCLLMCLLSMLLPAGNGALACFMLLALFQGPFFPTTLAMTLRGLGRHTKLVATGLIMNVCGGAIWPTISWAVQQSGNSRYAMRVSVVVYAVMLGIIAVINLHPTTRHWVDADGETAASFEAGQAIPTPGSVSSCEKRPRGSDALRFLTQPQHIEFAGRHPRPA